MALVEAIDLAGEDGPYRGAYDVARHVGSPAITISAPLTTLPNLCALVTKDTVYVARDLKALLTHARQNRIETPISTRSLFCYLHFGLVLTPDTIFENVYSLGPGDHLHVTRGDVRPTVRSECVYPFLERDGSGKASGTPSELFSLLVESVEATIAGHESMLMLSAGKDSVAIAMALGELGAKHVRAFTYVRDDEDTEGHIAARFARSLGVPHERVRGDCLTPEIVQAYATRMPLPCADHVLLSCFAVHHATAAGPNVTVVDGTGNDGYFGIVTKARDLVDAHRIIPTVGRRSPYVTGSRLEGFLPRHYLTTSEIARLGPYQGPAMEVAADLAYQAKGRSVFECKQLAIGRYFDPQHASFKVRVSAWAAGGVAAFPWASPKLAEYVWNLAPALRIDRKGKKNKVLLRAMLKERGYDADEIGKRIFYSPSQRFYRSFEREVTQEILACSLWGDDAAVLVRALYRRFRFHRNTLRAIHALYTLSLWWNRSTLAQAHAFVDR